MGQRWTQRTVSEMGKLVDIEDVRICAKIGAKNGMTLQEFLEDTYEWDSFVEVVRCKECVHYGSFNGEAGSCCSPCADSYFKVKPNDFCSRGEKVTE